MNLHLSHSLIVIIITITALTLFYACEDSISVQDHSSTKEYQDTEFSMNTNSKIVQDGEVWIIEGEYIVTFVDQWEGRISEQIGEQVDQLRNEIISGHSIREDSILHKYRYATRGFAATLSDEQVEKLREDPYVARVSPNVLMRLGIKNFTTTVDSKEKSSTGNLYQTIPWGVERVRGPLDGTGKKAWVIDTGIDLTHPDLNVDTDNSISFIAGESPNDGNGHGTHVAGIIAATGNTTDVVGVTAGATVVAVKVCFDEVEPSEEQCPIASILAGIDYVANNAHPDDVINISLWGPVNPDWDSAIASAATHGLRFTLIAGNAASDVSNYSPGRITHSNAWTMTAFDQNDILADFSNFGGFAIDFGGPGVDIFSLSNNGGTATSSGTSMAAPHVAGILLATGTNPMLNPSSPGDNPVPTDGTVINDPSTPADPIAVAPSDLSISVSGPSFVSNGQQGNWTASVSDGEPPYSNYIWYRNDEGHPPFWQQVSTSSSYSTVVTGSFELKVQVTDDSNTTRTSSVFGVFTN